MELIGRNSLVLMLRILGLILKEVVLCYCLCFIADLRRREALRVFNLFLQFVIFGGILFVVGKGSSFRVWCNWASNIGKF